MTTIRVSCGAICRMPVGEGFLLEIKEKQHGDMLVPLGGTIKCNEQGHGFLQKLGAIFQEGNDLRLLLPDDRLADFSDWFKTRNDRECDPLRELEEELVVEHGVSFPCTVATLMEITYLDLLETRALSGRAGTNSAITAYFHETFDVRLKPEAQAILIQATGRGASRLRIISQEEVHLGRSSEGIPIADHVRLFH